MENLTSRHHQFRRHARPTKFPMLDVTLAVAPDSILVYDRLSSGSNVIQIARADFGAWIQQQVDRLAEAEVGAGNG